MNELFIHLFAKLTADAAVGAFVADRVHPIAVASTAQRPFIAIELIDAQPITDKDGPASLNAYILSVHCVTDQTQQAIELGDAVRAALERNISDAGGVSIVGLEVLDIDSDWDVETNSFEIVVNVKVLK